MAEALPAALVTVTISVCEPTVSVLFAPDVQATAAAASHLQVVDAASVATQVAASGVVQMVVGNGLVMRTVGRLSAVKLFVAVVLPKALVALTLKLCAPEVSAFAGGEAGHGFCHVPLSHQQVTLVAPLVA